MFPQTLIIQDTLQKKKMKKKRSFSLWFHHWEMPYTACSLLRLKVDILILKVLISMEAVLTLLNLIFPRISPCHYPSLPPFFSLNVTPLETLR